MIPENRKIPAEQLSGIEAVIDGRVLPANPDQIINLNGLATKAWDYVYTAGTTMLFDVQRWYGLNPISGHSEYNKPREYFFDISRTGAREGNESVIFHSSLVEPEILKPNKPISPLATYADQATMLADQVNQVDTEYYYYTGSTSAWLYNGVANGLITDYTELVAIAGWEEWGTKPTWLIITGDAYLVGVDNLNKMTANFYRRYDSSGTTLIDVVVLNIEAFVLGNTDAERELALRVIENNYDENDDPVTIGSVENVSLYGDSVVMTIENLPSLNPPYYELVSVSNYALAQAMGTSTSTNDNTYRRIAYNAFLKRFFNNEEITIMMVVNFPVNALQVGFPSNRILCSRTNAGLTAGIRCSMDANQRLSIRSYHASGNRNATAGVGTEMIRSDNYWFIAITYKFVNATLREYRGYRASVDEAVAFEQIISLDDTNVAEVQIGIENDFEFERFPSVGTYSQKNDHLIIVPYALSSAQIEAIKNEIL